ncbi:MAG: hypothetical protein RRX95_04285 [Oscillospiraceae bacterium]
MVRLMPNGATKVLILVDGSKYDEVHGRWCSLYAPKEQVFNSCFELIGQIDEFYNYYSLVYSSTKRRSIVKVKSSTSNQGVFPRKEVKRYMNEDIFSQKQGEKATFIIQVMFRQNSTWQGSVKWVETGEETKFRSTMELVKMMDEVVCRQLGAEDEEIQAD